MQFTSNLLQQAIAEFSKLPGIGQKTALRYVLHLLKKTDAEVLQFVESINKLKTEIKACTSCNNLSDDTVCTICSNPSRQHHIVCIVETIRDLIAIENTQQYNGIYHVLGGLISPLDGIGPTQLALPSLIHKVNEGTVTEIILALSATIQGDTTGFYIQKETQNTNIIISTLSRGVAFGAELEYADEMTLGRSLQHRLPINKVIL
jgi:recombination protein RecR